MPEFTTKNESPVSLKPIVNKSVIEDMFTIEVEDAINDIDGVYEKIHNIFQGEKVIIRNSHGNENNTLYAENAEKGIASDVSADDRDSVVAAIFEVIDYYKGNDKKKAIASDRDLIIVQRQLDNIIISGVVFTKDIVYSRPYYMITYNYIRDDGFINYKKTKWIAKNVSREFLDDDFLNLVLAVREIEGIYEDVDGLDIEFGINDNGQIFIYRIIPMLSDSRRPCPMSDREFIDTKAFAKCNYLDHSNMLSDVLFWNPVEIIGANPRPLDYSIYKDVITSNIWQDAIACFGYSHENTELMHKIGNRPYLSLDSIFDATIPDKINSQLKYKLKEYYKERLLANRNNHKQAETKLLINTYDFNVDEKKILLKQSGFSKEEVNEILGAVFDVTNDMIRKYDDMCVTDKASLEELTFFRRQCRSYLPLSETNVMKLYNYVKELINSIKENGTPQYIRQVRCKYVALDICRSLVEKGYFSEDNMKEFLDSIPTISVDFDRDFEAFTRGEITREEFDSRYGHLRLGAYDIRSNCYRNKYFDLKPIHHDFFEGVKSDFEEKTFSTLDMDVLNNAIKDIGYDFDGETLFEFIVETSKNVEIFKYEFTKTLSLVLEIIIRMGELQMIAKEDMSYLEIQDLMDYHSRDSYIQIIEARRNMYYAYSYIVLPEYILNLGDIDVVDVDEKKPEFITESIIEAEIVNIDENCDAQIDGKVVVLTKSAQGYEWIFTKNIMGIITKYSENTDYIKKWCNFYGIPAAFGCGEMIFKKITSVEVIKLDCKNKKISRIR